MVALKQHSQHSHELVTRIIHPYDMACEPTHLTERDTTKEMVLQLAEEADVLHFHAVGSTGSVGHPETIHGIDWEPILSRKISIFHGMIADLQSDMKTFILRHGSLFDVPNREKYTALMGPHFSCKKTYGEHLKVVPDIVPIYDWLYTPQPGSKQPIAATFKDLHVVEACQKAGVDLRYLVTPTKLTEQLAWRRATCRVTFNGSVDGAWGLFALESMAQGIPTVAYTNPLNEQIWKEIDVPPPPIIACEYGGADVPETLRRVMNMPEDEWQHMAGASRWWMETYYRPRQIVGRWDDMYNQIFAEAGR